VQITVELRTFVKLQCSILVFLVFEEALHQFRPRVPSSSSSAPSSTTCGNSIRDLMCSSVAAISRNSPATSRLSVCMVSMTPGIGR